MRNLLTLETALALLVATFLIRHLPAKVLAATLLGYLGSLALLVAFVWLDLDKLALTFGLVAPLGALYGIPWLMRAEVLVHPPFGALLKGASPESEHAEVRQGLVAAFVLIVAAIVGAYAVDASILVFEIADHMMDA